MVSIVAVGLPASYLLGLVYGYGLPGLWIGYGLSNAILTVFYLGILYSLDWVKAAEKAAQDELEVIGDNSLKDE